MRLQALRAKDVEKHLGGQGVRMPETLDFCQRSQGGDPNWVGSGLLQG